MALTIHKITEVRGSIGLVFNHDNEADAVSAQKILYALVLAKFGYKIEGRYSEVWFEYNKSESYSNHLWFFDNRVFHTLENYGEKK